MLGIITPGLEQKLHALGFSSALLGMELNVGRVRVQAIEHPIDGIALMFIGFLPRQVCQFQVFAPKTSTALQLAALIYTNFRLNFPEGAPTCKAYFKSLGMLVV